MNASIATLLYLVSGVLFILSLRGLSSPATSQQGNRYGMIGMAIAIATTLALIAGHGGDSGGGLDAVTIGIILAGVAVGGGAGAVIAQRVQMTQMPQLVAAFHSLVGLAAVFVAAAAFLAPEAFDITDANGQIKAISRIEMSLGAAIGAITFSGSVIAFAKLNGNMSGAPILLPQRHLLNIAIGGAIIALIVAFAMSQGAANGGGMMLWIVIGLSFLIGVTLIIPIGGADMPVV
ncbi:MAG TPA: NAD synthetase, partial [Hyphomonadaceae bacterium]|nr:NAD synthetase [Hyphomonadaceae bacterium]